MKFYNHVNHNVKIYKNLDDIKEIVCIDNAHIVEIPSGVKIGIVDSQFDDTDVVLSLETDNLTKTYYTSECAIFDDSSGEIYVLFNEPTLISQPEALPFLEIFDHNDYELDENLVETLNAYKYPEWLVFLVM